MADPKNQSYSLPQDYINLKYPDDIRPKTLESKLSGLGHICMVGDGNIKDIDNYSIARFWSGVYDIEFDLVQDFWHALFSGMKGYSVKDVEVPFIEDETIADKVDSFYKNSVVYAGNIGKMIRQNGSKAADKDMIMKALCEFLEVDYRDEYLLQKKLIEESFLDEINDGIDNAAEQQDYAPQPLTEAPGKDQPTLYFNKILVGAAPSIN